jgi:exosortase E/protease (VPEID-CTERM system)
VSSPGSGCEEPSPVLTLDVLSRSYALSSSAEPLAALRPGALLPYRRWVALIVLLMSEMIALTVAFDGSSIARIGWWSNWLDWSSELPRVSIPVVVAMLLFGGARLRAEWLRHFDRTDRPHQPWLPLLAHLGAFALFAWVTMFIYGRDLNDSAHPGGWVIAWFGTGLIALACWAAAGIQPTLWWPLVRSASGAIVVGGAVGVAALGLGRLADQLWEPLAGTTLQLVHTLLRLIFSNTVCRPEEFIVGTGTFQVAISPQCSGYEGIGLIWAFLAAYLWLYRESLRFPQAWLLIPIGTAIIWLTNALRIASLVTIGTCVSADIAAGGFHSLAGWLAFNAVALGLVLASRQTRFFAKVVSADDQRARENPASAALAPLMSIVAVTMITGAFTVGFDGYYPLRVLAAAVTLYCFRTAYAQILRIPSWQAVSLGVVAFAVWMILEPTPSPGVSNSQLALGLARMPAFGAMTWLAFRVLGSVITVPIAEELAFRGYLIRRLVSPDVSNVAPGRFTWPSFLISSILFGALHGRWLAGTLAGMAYALALYRRGEVVDAIAAHATTNALIAGVVLATGSWSLWS